MATKFRTPIQIRPSDLDINGHVHNSVYLDYIMYARLDQMKRCYKFPMEEFLRRGYSWVAKVAHLEYRRPIMLNDHVEVITWLDSFENTDCTVKFEMVKGEEEKIAATGYFVFTMIDLKTGRPAEVPEDAIEAYMI